nr:AMP4 [Heteropoda venatoria]
MKLVAFFICLFLLMVCSQSFVTHEEEIRMDQTENLESERVLDLVTKTLEDLPKTVKGLLPL